MKKTAGVILTPETEWKLPKCPEPPPGEKKMRCEWCPWLDDCIAWAEGEN